MTSQPRYRKVLGLSVFRAIYIDPKQNLLDLEDDGCITIEDLDIDGINRMAAKVSPNL